MRKSNHHAVRLKLIHECQLFLSKTGGKRAKEKKCCMFLTWTSRSYAPKDLGEQGQEVKKIKSKNPSKLLFLEIVPHGQDNL